MESSVLWTPTVTPTKPARGSRIGVMYTHAHPTMVYPNVVIVRHDDSGHDLESYTPYVYPPANPMRDLVIAGLSSSANIQCPILRIISDISHVWK